MNHPLPIGSYIKHPSSNTKAYGVIVSAKVPENFMGMIGAKGFQQASHEYSVAWFNEEDQIQPLDSVISVQMDDYAVLDKEPASTITITQMVIDAEQARLVVIQSHEDKFKRQQDERAAFLKDAEPRVPPGTKGIIFARLKKDETDTQSDYFGSKTTRRVLLAFSKTSRNNFKEMRKAAATFPDTAHLATIDETGEHREDYRGGGGYYLKDGWHHSDGWMIVKRRYENVRDLPDAEWSPALRQQTDPSRPQKREPNPPKNTSFTIEKHTHSKKGFDMWITIPAERVSKEKFSDLLATAREHNGWYTRKWGDTPAGFAFKTEAKAQDFLSAVS